MASGGKTIFRLVSDILDDVFLARELRKDERKHKTVRLGVKSIIFSLLMVGFAALFRCYFLVIDNPAGMILGFFFMLLLGAAGAILCFVRSLVCWILQLTLNRKFVSWLALLLFLVGIGGIALLFVMF